jgi:hypothetical protein
MTLIFKYKDVPRPNNTHSTSPSIPVTLSGKGGKYEFMVLLDSGADVSAIPKHMAELLNLDLNHEKEEAFGIGGKVPAVSTYMDIEINKPHESHGFRIPVKVILDEYDFPPLIGRAGFFDKFDITFSQTDKRVSLKYKADNKNFN